MWLIGTVIGAFIGAKNILEERGAVRPPTRGGGVNLNEGKPINGIRRIIRKFGGCWLHSSGSGLETKPSYGNIDGNFKRT